MSVFVRHCRGGLRMASVYCIKIAHVPDKAAEVVVLEVLGENGGRKLSGVPDEESSSIRTPGDERRVLSIGELRLDHNRRCQDANEGRIRIVRGPWLHAFLAQRTIEYSLETKG